MEARLGPTVLVRRIYAAVRDRNWDTVPFRIGRESVEQTGDGFRASFDAEARQQDIAFAWRATVLGSAADGIEFCLEGRALTTFLHCRTGFCVNHPVRECAGLPC